LDGRELCADKVVAVIVELGLGQCFAAGRDLNDRDIARTVLHDQWRLRARRQYSQNGLRDGRQLADAIVSALGRRRNRARINQILVQVDEMLAKYIRAQLSLAGLSFVFYSGSMLCLRFPFSIPLGLLGGILEFLPGVGWVASAAVFLTIGFLTHAHWIWMGVLLMLWRLVQDYVNSPRIMGDNLQLEPLTVLFSLMVGGQIGGIAGLYLSVPTVAVLRIVWLGCFPSDNPAEISEQQLAQAKA